ncbi:MAG: PorP/SprF family type IX secretion system membrane protein [Flavobacteriales bacterium]
MKKIIILFLLTLSFSGFSQQIPQYTHYLLNQFAYNPAVAGSKNCMDATLGHRTQWSGFDGAPVTTYGSFNTTLKQDKYGLGYKHAMGLVVVRDSYGPFSRMKIKGAYAYHLPVTKKMLMSMGMFFGVEQIAFDAGEVTTIDPDDDAIDNSRRATIFPEFTPGILLQTDVWFAGATLQQPLGGPKKAVGTDETRLNRHVTLLGGLNIRLNKQWSLVPSSLVKITKTSPIAIDINVMADYKSKFSFGASYRNVDAFAGLISFRCFNYLKIGYAYDMTLSKIRFGSFNTHEVTLSINPCGYKEKAKYGCPTFN